MAEYVVVKKSALGMLAGLKTEPTKRAKAKAAPGAPVEKKLKD